MAICALKLDEGIHQQIVSLIYFYPLSDLLSHLCERTENGHLKETVSTSARLCCADITIGFTLHYDQKAYVYTSHTPHFFPHETTILSAFFHSFSLLIDIFPSLISSPLFGLLMSSPVS